MQHTRGLSVPPALLGSGGGRPGGPLKPGGWAPLRWQGSVSRRTSPSSKAEMACWAEAHSAPCAGGQECFWVEAVCKRIDPS